VTSALRGASSFYAYAVVDDAVLSDFPRRDEAGHFRFCFSQIHHMIQASTEVVCRRQRASRAFTSRAHHTLDVRQRFGAPRLHHLCSVTRSLIVTAASAWDANTEAPKAISHNAMRVRRILFNLLR
jgi:hypothetical protein